MPTRRDFLAAAAAGACAGALGGCAALNPAPQFEADEAGTLDLPAALAEPGGQVKVRIPGVDDLLLVWRADDGCRATSITCTHWGSQVRVNVAAKSLDCPSHGSRFAWDGAVLKGPAKLPLKSYRVTERGGRLKIDA